MEMLGATCGDASAFGGVDEASPWGVCAEIAGLSVAKERRGRNPLSIPFASLLSSHSLALSQRHVSMTCRTTIGHNLWHGEGGASITMIFNQAHSHQLPLSFRGWETL
eukprot:GHVT01040521.1.p1 GENE.GHVT01040521.1~~GHVT01040521.1.p1  ORF type:complete len:108 (-),score=10.64 GHVT01040521.1:587-910(-)